jgi:hypothetical protein
MFMFTEIIVIASLALSLLLVASVWSVAVPRRCVPFSNTLRFEDFSTQRVLVKLRADFPHHRDRLRDQFQGNRRYSR